MAERFQVNLFTVLTPSNRENEKANEVNENLIKYRIHGQSSLYIMNVCRLRRRAYTMCVRMYVRVYLIDCNYLHSTIGMPSLLLYYLHAKQFLSILIFLKPAAILRLCHT